VRFLQEHEAIAICADASPSRTSRWSTPIPAMRRASIAARLTSTSHGR
jgi:hypothetical protein